MRSNKKYKCNECNQIFKKVYHMKNHVRSHTQETPFKCTICQREFSQKCNMEKHVQMHGRFNEDKKNIPKFKCHICLRHFPLHKTLKVHLSKDHDLQVDPQALTVIRNLSMIDEDLMAPLLIFFLTKTFKSKS
jgi:uncharacterized Zn-finger protein